MFTGYSVLGIAKRLRRNIQSTPHAMPIYITDPVL